MKRQVVNPYLPAWEYVPDGEPHLFDHRVYIYGSHDEAGGDRYCTGDYVCWSAPEEDLTSWTFEGTIYHTYDDPAYCEEEDIRYYAPDACQGPDGRYYLYYFSSKIEKIGVAVCDTPAGNYRYWGDIRFEDGSPLTRDSGYGMLFDPAILSDESGNWLYYGFALQKYKEKFHKEGYRGGFAVRLADDMLTMISEPVPVVPGKLYSEGTEYEGHAFLEASSIRHIGERYYLVYSSERGHELCYAFSRYPDRDFVYGGVIISNGDVGIHSTDEEDAIYYLGNNHGGLLRLMNGQNYIFYHRHTHGSQFSRQGCAETVRIQEDGRIAQVEITSCGLNDGPLRARGEYSAHIACHLRSREGIQHYSSHVFWNDAHPYISQENGKSPVASSQNLYIFNLKDGAVCGFKYFRFDGDEKEVRVRVRGNLKGCINVHLDRPDGPVSAVLFPGSAEYWSWVRAELEPVQGDHALYFEISGSGSCDFDAFEIR